MAGKFPNELEVYSWENQLYMVDVPFINNGLMPKKC